MNTRRSNKPLIKLINKVISFCQPDESTHDIDNPAKPSLRASTDLESTPPKTPEKHNKMAEEEDFSSMPLADRWVHKVHLAGLLNLLSISFQPIH